MRKPSPEDIAYAKTNGWRRAKITTDYTSEELKGAEGYARHAGVTRDGENSYGFAPDDVPDWFVGDTILMYESELEWL